MISAHPRGPEIFLFAAQKLGYEASDCIIIEDSFNGVRAAHASGAYVIMVPDLVMPDDQIKALADAVLPSLGKAGEYLFENSFFRN